MSSLGIGASRLPVRAQMSLSTLIRGLPPINSLCHTIIGSPGPIRSDSQSLDIPMIMVTSPAP